VRVGGQALILDLWRQALPADGIQVVSQQLRTHAGQPVMQARTGILRPDRAAGTGQDRPGIQTGFHLHETDPGLGITGQDSALDGGCPAPARQQGGVHIDASEARSGEEGCRQDQSIGHDHHQVRLMSRQPGDRRLALQAERLADPQPVPERELLDRAGEGVSPPPGGSVRPGVDGDHFGAALQQDLQGGNCEVGRTGKDDFHASGRACRGRAGPGSQ